MSDPARQADVKGSVALAHALFLLSGVAGLVYEVSWSRQVGVALGHTAQSAAVVLAAYFAGMAAGQLLGGGLAGRLPPLLGYGVVELLVAAWSCVVPALLSRTTEPAWCFLILLPATVPLGATLPFVAEFLAKAERRVAMAYALNTAGGLVGVIGASAFLPDVGVTASSYLAAGLSAACGLAACVASFRRTVVTPRSNKESDGPSWGWLTLAAISGFGTLGLEVLYTRLFSLVLHNSTYTFGAVVAVFLLALSVGAALAALLGRRFTPGAIAAASSCLGAAAVPVSVVLFVRLTGLSYFAAGDTFAGYLTATLALVAAVVLPPITLLGMALPAAFQSVRDGSGTGRLASANTLAAAVGAVAAGFVLLPWLGLWGTFALHGGLFAVAGVFLLLRGRRWAFAAGLSAVVAAASVVLLAGPPSEKEGEIVRRWESAYGWIDVVRDRQTGSRQVRQNLHYRHGSTAGAVHEARLGRLPLLLHPRPTDVAFLGLGTGLTASPAVADPDVQSAVIVELIPEVVEAARLLGDANADVVDHEKVTTKTDDARHYLHRTDRRFDVIVSDLFVPWESRAGYLSVVEFYETARRRLKPGGRFWQWLALYQLGADEFELIADSFASVFPNVTLWWGQLDGRHPIVALVGGEEPMRVDPVELEARLDASRSDDADVRTVADVLGFYLGDWPHRRSRRLNTDEHPWLEFRAPLSHKANRTLQGKTLRSYFDRVLTELPSDGVRVDRPLSLDARKRQAAQRLSLFGAAEP